MPCRLDTALRRVREMLREEVPLEHIEAEIEHTALDREEKAVLWLYAWCDGHASELRDIVMTEESGTTA